MESEAITTGIIRGAEGRAGIMAAVASVAGFVNGLASIVAGHSEANNADGSAADSPVTGVAADDDPLAAFADACLDGLAMIARVEAATAALKMRLINGHVGAVVAMEDPASSPEWARGREMATVAEVACLLTIGERAAGALIGEAQALTGSLPAALDALQAGEVSWSNARVLVDETTGLDAAATAALEAHFLGIEPAPEYSTGQETGQDVDEGADQGPVQEPLLGLNDLDDGTGPVLAGQTGPVGSGGSGARCWAGELPAARLRRRVRTWREREHPESIEARHVKGVADRRMEYTPDRDGMASIVLYVPADKASAIWNRTTAIARGTQGPDEPRTITQLRPDIAADLLLGAGFISDDAIPAAANDGETPASSENSADGSVSHGYLKLGKAPAPRAQVLVMVPALSLLGATDEPALLDGHGPIPASMARQLVAEGAESLYRVLVDPRDGAPLEIGRKSYRVPEALRRWLRLRDGKCPFPGCSNNSLDNEADHILAWQHGGSTGVRNLGLPCKKHHRVRHITGWEPTPATKDDPPGWISPTGRYYASEHQDWQPPQWPPGLLPGIEPNPPRDGVLLEPPPEGFTDERFLPEEPPADHLIDEDDLPPDHEAWDILYTMPIPLPRTPSKTGNSHSPDPQSGRPAGPGTLQFDVPEGQAARNRYPG